MIFQYTWQMVLDGRKTQTSRIVKPGETINEALQTVLTAGGRTKYRVGQRIAVQPARTQKAIACVTLTDVRQSSTLALTDEDAVREGVANLADFIELWNSIHTRPGVRIEDDPQLWVLRFKLVSDE